MTRRKRGSWSTTTKEVENGGRCEGGGEEEGGGNVDVAPIDDAHALG